MPNLPTDSLYKFIFVGGILLSILSVYLQSEAENTFITVKYEDELFNRQSSIDSIIRANDDFKDSVLGRKYVSNSEIRKLKLDTSEFKFADIDTAGLRKLNNLHLQITKQKERLDRIDKNLNDAQLLLIYSLIMTLIGGISWYFLVQRLQDELLEAQVITSRIELKKLRDSIPEKPVPITPEPDIKQLPESTEDDKQA